ncbi:MAG: hypothetical protein FJ054_04095 [Cyanobacteria bacterium M_surface_10_m2_119]|nr:hypothetical protein [Cyanobacteria bacterium M_surface_10_m2_119]
MGELPQPSQPPAPFPSPSVPSASPCPRPPAPPEPVLCQHCGRTASNGISCEGYCVADSGY